MPSRSIHLMLVATHPADSFDQAGGTLAHHVARGDKVTVVIATTGVRSHHSQLQEERRTAGAEFDVEARVKEAAQQKLEETRNACRILGFEDIRDLGFEDDDTLLSEDKIEAITEAIRDVKPDILITHQPYEIGGLIGHATVGQATIHAWQRAMGVGRGRQERHYVPLMYFMNPQAFNGYTSLGYAGTARVDLYVDITDVIDKKVQALDYISSQYYGGAYARKRSEGEDGAHGGRGNVAYAEQFQALFPMRRYTLPITDADLDLIDEAPEARMGRIGEIVGGLMAMPTGMAFTSQYRVPKEKYGE